MPRLSEGLLDRVKAASGPDRQLDAEIMFDLFAKPVGVKDDGGPSGYLWPEDDPSWAFGIRFPGQDREWFFRSKTDDKETLLIVRDGAFVKMNALRVLNLTDSVDAVLKVAQMVLPDTVRPVLIQQPEGVWEAAMLRVAPDESEVERVSASSAPLALLRAMLVALPTV